MCKTWTGDRGCRPITDLARDTMDT
jgi:hypothetical protein